MSDRVHFSGTTTASGQSTFVSAPTPSLFSTDIQVPVGNPKVTTSTPRADEKAKVEAAVYSYMQAVRALGRNRVNTREIAEALGLTVAEVDAVLPALQGRGVKEKR